jgi:vitamin B12/bleomycin/antimicrobial peptide transport system ATP-binding/permease protein
MQVQSSLRWFVDNFSTIADWRATLLRVASFRGAVLATDELHDVASRIEFAEGPPGRIAIDGLTISSPAGCIKLEEARAEFVRGDHVLATGDSGTGKTLLFRALAGLWPWGHGRVTRPKGERLLFLPRTSYLPPGTLREVLAYPRAVEEIEREAYGHALERLGLERLAPMLDESKRWDLVLNEAEQQSLAFARALLQAPDWLVIDEALESLEQDQDPKVSEVLSKDLARTGILYIGRAGAHDALFKRVLHLVDDDAARKLPPQKTAAAPGMAAPAAAAG